MGNDSEVTETTEQEVVKPLTKTDARELKALVRSDSKILLNTLKQREQWIEMELRKEMQRREGENKKAAKKELAALVRRVNTLNEAIVAKLNELSDAGWTQQEYRKTVPIQPRDFTVSLELGKLVPPESAEAQIGEAFENLHSQYWDAQRAVERREGEMIRELTLRSVASEAAREFILAMPTPDDLLPLPPVLEGREVPTAIEG